MSDDRGANGGIDMGAGIPAPLSALMSDAVVAADLKSRTVIALQPVLAVLNQAKSLGFEVNFVIDDGSANPQGLRQLVRISCVKVF